MKVCTSEKQTMWKGTNTSRVADVTQFMLIHEIIVCKIDLFEMGTFGHCGGAFVFVYPFEMGRLAQWFVFDL